MNASAARNALDENREGLMGRSVDRVDGRLQVMGKATYSHEVQEGGQPACGFILEATIVKGNVAEIDANAAERCAGVLLVMTHESAPKQAPWGPITEADRLARSSPQLADNRIKYYGQPVAFVVAQSFAQARSAARLTKDSSANNFDISPVGLGRTASLAMACVACHTSHCRLALHPNPTAIGQRYLLTSPNVRYAMTLGDYELAPNLSNAEKPADNKYQKTDSVVCEFEPAFAAPPYSPQVAFWTWKPPRHGYFVNHDRAGYHARCHADIPMIKAHFLPEVDDKGNPLKIKCVGELGMCGAGAASANAVYDVCGVRIHEHPLTVNKVIAGLEKQPA